MKLRLHKIFLLNPPLVIVIGLSITLISSFLLFRVMEREKQTAFEAHVLTATDLIQNRMAHYEGALIDARAHLKNIDITRTDLFTSYARDIRLTERFPGLLGLGLARAIREEEADALERQLRRHYPEFAIWPSKKTGRTLYPIVALEPMNEMNSRALGFDMGSEEVRRKAMETAEALRLPVLSGRITLVQERKNATNPGFNFYLPYTDQNGKLVGFVYSPFRTRDLFREILEHSDLGVAVKIYSGREALPDKLLYESPEKDYGSYETKRVITIGHQPILLDFRNLPSLYAGVSYGSLWAMGALGILTTFILFSLVAGSRREMLLIEKQLEAASTLRLKDEIIEQSLNGFDIINAGGTFIYVNPAYVRMWGYDSAEEIIGTSPAGHCADPETPLKIIGALKSKGYCDIEFTAKRKDGSTFEVRMLSFLAHDVNGQEIYPTTSIDISQNKAALRARDEFLSLASHELKTPLTSLSLQLQLFEKLMEKTGSHVDPERQAKFLSISRAQVARLSRLVDDMLDVSRIATGKLSLRRESTDLRILLTEVIERMQSQFTTAKISFPVVADGPPVIGNWDRLRIDQAIANLLTNAIKYGRGTPVTAETGTENDGAWIRITDEGPGIPESAQNRIFDRYQREEKSTEISGLGLGLYLTRQIVEAHGGTISVKSAPGKGASFTITLPFDGTEREGISYV